MRIRYSLLSLLFLLLPFSGFAQEEQFDDDFVITSLLFASPGDVLYSRVGHVAIRMECPEHNLDYVFSYESEDASRKIISFLAGKLKMGLYAFQTQDYLDQYIEENREVKQYRLTLPIEAKRNLWRILDNHLQEGMALPYDYLQRGCAYSALQMLDEGIAPLKIHYGTWPDSFHLSRRELTGIQMDKYPWVWCFMNLICNGSIDESCTYEEKVIMPQDLLRVLSNASVDNVPIMQDEPVTLISGSFEPKSARFTPLMLSLILLLLTIVCLVLRKSAMDYVLLAIQTILGIVTVYLVCFSSLCCTEWSWLIIPFNPLPLIFWKWRKYWRIPYAFTLIAWAAFMVFSKHQLTDWPYVVMAIALAVSYFSKLSEPSTASC